MRHPHPLTLLAIACVALAGCNRSSGDAVPAAPEPAAVPAAPPAAAAAQATAHAPAPQYDFYLLPRKGEPVEDPRIVSTQQDHPCGPIDLVRVAAIPLDDPVFMPAFVVEFDGAGNEIGKWGIPSEAEVVALDGQRLQFQVETGRFWVSPDGSLQKLDGATHAADLRRSEGMFECPKLPTFAASGAEQCFRVKDAVGRERLIAMEGVCS